MTQLVFQTFALPEAPLDAAAYFFTQHVAEVRELLAEGMTRPLPKGAVELDALAFVFPPAGQEHHGWRLAAIQELAREAAPKRVNGVVGADPAAIDQATEWLAGAAGVTGQLIEIQAA